MVRYIGGLDGLVTDSDLWCEAIEEHRINVSIDFGSVPSVHAVWVVKMCGALGSDPPTESFSSYTQESKASICRKAASGALGWSTVMLTKLSSSSSTYFSHLLPGLPQSCTACTTAATDGRLNLSA